MSQSIALNIRTPQPDLAAITRAAHDANLNDYQLRNAPAKSELEALQLQDEIGERTALGSYREATAAGDPQAIDKLAAYPKMQREMSTQRILGLKIWVYILGSKLSTLSTLGRHPL